MAYVHSTGAFPELLWPGLMTGWGTEYKEYETLYTKFFDVQKSDKQFEKEQQIVGFPTAGIKEEGQEASFSQMLQGYQKEYRHYTYSIGAVITKEMVEDDQYRVISKIPKFLARSMKDVQEVVAHNILNNAFNTGFTGADGSALCVTNHSLVGGGTGQNTLTTAADLTQTSLETAIQDILNYTDDQGLRMKVDVKKLIVPTGLNFTARKILETQYATGSTDNDVNIISNMGIEPIITPYLTDTDAWFLITDMDNSLTFFIRRNADLSRDNDFGTDNLKIKTTMRFSAGFTDWRGVYGSPGA
jgi:phage major head subunit gpT-like protein